MHWRVWVSTLPCKRKRTNYQGRYSRSRASPLSHKIWTVQPWIPKTRACFVLIFESDLSGIWGGVMGERDIVEHCQIQGGMTSNTRPLHIIILCRHHYKGTSQSENLYFLIGMWTVDRSILHICLFRCLQNSTFSSFTLCLAVSAINAAL